MNFKCLLGRHAWDQYEYKCSRCGKEFPLTVLADIATSHPEWMHRKRALTKLADQKLLAHAAGTDSEFAVRRAAIELMTDQLALGEVAKHLVQGQLVQRSLEAHGILFSAILDKIADQSVLADVAKNAKDCEVRRSAVTRLTDPKVLAYIAANDSDNDVRKMATKFLGYRVPVGQTSNSTQMKKPQEIAWASVVSRFGAVMSLREIEDNKEYPNVRLHTFFLTSSDADRALGRIDNEVAAALRPTNEGMSDVTGTQRYHVVHEGKLTGKQIKGYLIVATNGGGEIWEVLC